jgi:hypothetical protein
MPSFYTGSNVQYIRVPAGIFLSELRRYCTERTRYVSLLYFSFVRPKVLIAVIWAHTTVVGTGGLVDGGAHAEIKKKRPI